MAFDITKTVALITGANRGIGRAIAEGLLKAGAKKVYAAVRREASADELIATYGDRVVAIPFDLSDEEAAGRAAKAAGDVTLLVSNAGIVEPAGPSDETMLTGLKNQIEANLYPVVRLALAFGPVLKANGGGAFVQMNSVASLTNFLPFTGYSASKAAAFSFTQALRQDWDEQGTQVISVIAGPIKTDMADAAGVGDDAPPASVVFDGIQAALKSGDFFVYPDEVAQGVGEAYAPFARAVMDISA
ncbi:SDR family oxidoreductase [Thalassococcus sp. S3]|uniref:SDR family oxidoreductase n=1 Tax=Thalassococcus sp. S3 TaxID=2017482 RepID=UPI0010248318|nr:SDR family oxidoreductase [Thalassococcus sp. S3]QBF33255.1 short-chain dehydrogenase [Thalassococcus sp. S3]